MNQTSETGIRVFIVEDEALIVMELRVRLQELGYTVCGTAVEADIAFTSIIDLKPDVVLMDVNIAGEQSGTELAQRLQAHIKVPVVFLTAYTNDEILSQASTANAYGYLTKPFQEKQLYTAIETAVAKFKTAKTVEGEKDYLEQRAHNRREALTETLDKLDKAHKTRNRILAAASHEIRTPLNAILGSAQVFATKGPSPEESLLLLWIDRNSRMILDMTHNIAEEKPTLISVPVALQNADLQEILAKVISLLGACSPMNRFTLKADDDTPFFVQTDSHWLPQVLVDVVSEMIEDADKGTPVEFQLDADNLALSILFDAGKLNHETEAAFSHEWTALLSRMNCTAGVSDSVDGTLRIHFQFATPEGA